MADPNNPGQFGNRPDTVEQASKGGKASPGSFGAERGADPSKAGKMSTKAQLPQTKPPPGAGPPQRKLIV